jgi:chromosome segregation ATPase
MIVHQHSCRLLGLVSALWMLGGLPGCVVEKMHQDLAATRAGVEKLSDLAPALERTNAALDRSNAQLERMYAELRQSNETLKVVVGKLDEANAQLQLSATQLKRLEPMMVSLKSLDESMASLRKVIENIDKAIPLLNITRGTPPADASLQRQRRENADERSSDKPQP